MGLQPNCPGLSWYSATPLQGKQPRFRVGVDSATWKEPGWQSVTGLHSASSARSWYSVMPSQGSQMRGVSLVGACTSLVPRLHTLVASLHAVCPGVFWNVPSGHA